jgi:D-apionolactonase
MERQDLRAGPLRLVLEDGALRSVRLGDREVLQAVRMAVRDVHWGTVPHRFTRFEIEQAPDCFRARFSSEDEEGAIAFGWDGEVEGCSDGTLVYRFRGVARTTFMRNRIGLVVLHPIEGCAGRPCTVEDSAGRVHESAFPRDVAPEDPFTDIRAIAYGVAPSLRAEIRFEGDVFEMEDHRNWTDYSFKTFGTPLARTHPVEVGAGTVLEQSVTLRLLGDRGAWPAETGQPARVEVRIGAAPERRLPRVGTRLTLDRPLTAAERIALAALHLTHLRADLDAGAPDLSDRLRRAAETSRAVGASLEAAAFVSPPYDRSLALLAETATAFRDDIGSWLVFDRDLRVTTPGLAGLAKEAFGGVTPGALVGAGSDVYFAELNRNRPAALDGDFLCHPSSPQVHAFDDATLFENLRSVPWMADTARAFANGRPLAVSPVTLRPHGCRWDTADPRLSAPLGAAWTAAHLCASLRSGLASLTYHEAAGAKGLVGEDGAPRPVFRALLACGPFAEAQGAPAASSDSRRVEGMFLSRPVRRLVLVNLTAERAEAALAGLAEVEGRVEDLGPYEVRVIGLDSAAAGGASKLDALSRHPVRETRG